MNLTYFKRYRMEIDLLEPRPQQPEIPPGYRLIPWQADLVQWHAEAKFHSFRSEIDANVFSCLGEMSGCLRLMSEIARKEGFLPSATWLLAYDPQACSNSEHEIPDVAIQTDSWDTSSVVPGNLNDWVMCGTVQGIRDRTGMGAIQNLGIVPEHRGLGLGSVLLERALAGFRQAGLTQAFLEVTAQNQGAIRLYRRLGFVSTRTVYKAVEVAYS